MHQSRKIVGTITAVAAALAFFFPTEYARSAGVDLAKKDAAAFPRCLHISQLPEIYGRVVFSYNESGPNHLYIIGVGHRDSVTGLRGEKTARIQAEIYKIAEWLVLNKEVELLVPEGFFEKTPGNASRYGPPRKNPSIAGESLKRLEKCFADDSNPVHAGKLLLSNHGLRVRQIEDRPLYDAALQCLVALEKKKSSAPLSLESELAYLQQKRTATMLQKIPGVVAEEFLEGNIRGKEAIFTVGLNHVAEIIQYVETEKIKIYRPDLSAIKSKDYIADVNLLKDGFGITIIIPRTLAEEGEVLKMTRLDTILASGKATSIKP